ncbi:MAG TPA: lasso peptide biosynthesis B2 protein [Verrucomicrobiae bacterium]|jgi:hypothetical protein
MRLIARYKQLSARERRLFYHALVHVLSIRMRLWLLPFRVTRNWVERQSKPAGAWRDLEHRSIREVTWAVEAASRRIPGATCLTQGMATQVMLGQLGQHSELRLGVARSLDGQFEAHAWVETQGRIVIGGAIKGFERFAQLRGTSLINNNQF